MATPASQVSAGAVYTIWGVSLLFGIGVIIVVAYLLRQVERSARHIHQTVAEIWIVGQQIAGATVHIPELAVTNRIVRDIHITVERILQVAEAIREHAESCPGCPQCVLKR